MLPDSPPAFLQLTKAFHQDVAVIYDSEGELVRDAVGVLSPTSAWEVVVFVRKMLAADDDELDRVWGASRAEVDLPPTQLRRLFLLLEDEAARPSKG